MRSGEVREGYLAFFELAIVVNFVVVLVIVVNCVVGLVIVVNVVVGCFLLLILLLIVFCW